jgi:hypothetical protein
MTGPQLVDLLFSIGFIVAGFGLWHTNSRITQIQEYLSARDPDAPNVEKP